MFVLLAKLNKLLLPSLTKSGLDVTKAKSWQKVLLAYRYFVTVRALDKK
ncbi:MAG: SsrA-binding protein [Flavobacterium psychrophilum]